jgi:hypothetical protein
MKTPNPAIDLKFAADRLGAIKASIADLETEAEIFKGALILSGAEAVEGDKFRAAVSHCPGRVIVNWRALAEHLGATPALVEEFTETGVPYSTVRVSARKGV